MTIVFERRRIGPEALQPGPRFPRSLISRDLSCSEASWEPWDEKDLSARVPEAPELLCKASGSRHLSANPSTHANLASSCPFGATVQPASPRGGLARCGEWALAQRLSRSQPLRPDAGREPCMSRREIYRLPGRLTKCSENE